MVWSNGHKTDSHLVSLPARVTKGLREFSGTRRESDSAWRQPSMSAVTPGKGGVPVAERGIVVEVVVAEAGRAEKREESAAAAAGV